MQTHPTRRGYFLSSLGGAVLGALLVAILLIGMLPAAGKTGDPLVLGAANRSGRSTWLTSGGPAVMKLNNSAGNPVLDLRNGGGSAPLAVDSRQLVSEFNADRLDGRHARDLIRVGYDMTTDASDGDGPAVQVPITAPRRGFLVATAAIDVSGNTYDLYTCQLTVDGEVVAGTEMHSAVHALSGHTANHSENCVTTGVLPVAAGSHVVGLDIANWDSASLNEASLWAMYLPFDDSGQAPDL